MLWSKVFQCDIPHIDAQHKALFDHIDRLGTMHGDISRIPQTLEFLELYTCEHFADEESLHQQTRFPRALEHRRQHEAFIGQIKKLRGDYDACGHNLGTLMEVNHSLVTWLSSHILGADKVFVDFYNPLPPEVKAAVQLPRRPWMPDAEQDAAKGNTTRVIGATTRMIGGTAVLIAGSWTDSMLCGIPLIDEQHKELFYQLDLLRSRGNKDRIPAILRFLADYVVKHFNEEESLHLKSKYPYAREHRKLHEDFVKVFWELKAKFDKSEGAFADVMEVNRVVYDWLKNHVLKVDKSFAQYYLSLEEASQ